MRRSSSMCVQSGGIESTMAWKSSASPTRGDIIGGITRDRAGASYNRPVIVAADYELMSERAGLVDRSARGKLMLTGAEATEFLQGQVTNDVEALRPGEGCYAALLTHKGKMVADMRVLRGPDFLWLDTEPAALPVMLRN